MPEDTPEIIALHEAWLSKLSFTGQESKALQLFYLDADERPLTLEVLIALVLYQSRREEDHDKFVELLLFNAE